MSVKRNVNVKITGQVPGEYNDNEYGGLIAKLKVICAERGLKLEEDSE